jgi:arginine:pyruvate transaminase
MAISSISRSPTTEPRPDPPSGIISLAVGDPGHPPPRAAVAAIAAELARGTPARYLPPQGLRPLRARIADLAVAGSGGSPVDPDQVVVTTGASVGLAAVLLATTDPGDEVLCPDPGFPAFSQLVRQLGRSVVWYPASSLDAGVWLASLPARIGPRCRALIWNSPANPTGAVASEQTAAAVAALALERSIALISDEVYADLVFDGQHVSPRSYVGPRCYGVFSFSKSYGLAGWRLGYVLAPPGAAARVAQAHWSLAMSAPSLAQRAALGALSEGSGYLETRRQELRDRRDRVVDTLAAAGLRCDRPAAAHFLWLDMRDTGLTGAEAAAASLAEAGVEVAPGAPFGPSGAGHVRLSFGGPDRDVAAAVHRFGQWYASRAVADAGFRSSS